MLAASLAVAVQVELAQRIGGQRVTIYENSRVVSIDLESSKPTLRTSEHTITVEKLIVASGSWISKLFPNLVDAPKPTLQQVLYFQPEDPAPFQIGRFPVFIFKGDNDDDQYYGMPGFLGTGVKAARHGGPPVDPEAPPAAVDPDYPSLVRGFLGRFLPPLQEARILSSEVCLYTVSPDDAFRIGFIEDRDDILIASPCSGHGFKFSADRPISTSKRGDMPGGGRAEQMRSKIGKNPNGVSSAWFDRS
jgi:sarcosine oxidase